MLILLLSLVYQIFGWDYYLNSTFDCATKGCNDHGVCMQSSNSCLCGRGYYDVIIQDTIIGDYWRTACGLREPPCINGVMSKLGKCVFLQFLFGNLLDIL